MPKRLDLNAISRDCARTYSQVTKKQNPKLWILLSAFCFLLFCFLLKFLHTGQGFWILLSAFCFLLILHSETCLNNVPL